MCLSSALCFTFEYLGHLNFAINLLEQDPDLLISCYGSSRGARVRRSQRPTNMPSVTSGEGLDTVVCDLILRSLRKVFHNTLHDLGSV